MPTCTLTLVLRVAAGVSLRKLVPEWSERCERFKAIHPYFKACETWIGMSLDDARTQSMGDSWMACICCSSCCMDILGLQQSFDARTQSMGDGWMSRFCGRS
eukprot:1159898-Pelagomonas_calceolata.AAC.8